MSLRDYIGRARAFLALANLELNLLAFAKTGVAGRLDLRVVHKQVVATLIGRDKSKAFSLIKPFYCTCTHYCTPLALQAAINQLPVSRIS